MTLLEAIVLGILQGLTEFLPISSTAHVTIAGKALGLIDTDYPQAWTAFLAVMQLGTLMAVVAYFFHDLVGMLGSLSRDLRKWPGGMDLDGWGVQTKVAVFVVVGTMPVAVVGLLFRDPIEGVLTKSTTVIASSLILLALLLWAAERVARHTRKLENITIVDALIVGFAQALALIPGSSRSGTTITAGLFLGLQRETAARFSFLLSIPAVLASGVYEMSRIDPQVFSLGVGNLIVATLVSAVSGYAAIAWLLRYLASRTTMVFVWYRLALGGALFSLMLGGIMD